MIEPPSLYPHQEKVRDAVREALVSHRRVILCAPCGFGKTRIAKHILGASVNLDRGEGWSGRSLFAVQRRGLVTNASDSFNEEPQLPHGIIMAGEDTSPASRVQVASIDSANSWYIGEHGRYETEYTYDLVMIDECVTGDAVVDTDIGPMRLDQIPEKHPSTVRSYSADKGEHFAKISHWTYKGFCDTIEIHTHTGKVRCTPDHEIFTRRGWLQAQHILLTDEILAFADAAESRGKGITLLGGASHTQPQNTIGHCGMTCTKSPRFASVGADAKCDLTSETLASGSSWGPYHFSTSMLTAARTARPTSPYISPDWSGRPFSELSLAIHPSATQTPTLSRHGCQARTATSKRHGQSTRPNSSIGSMPEREWLPATAGGSGLLLHLRRAIRPLLQFTTSSDAEAKNAYHGSGLTASATSASLGGYATTEAPPPKACLCTLRDSRRRKTNSSQSGSGTISVRQLCAVTAKSTPTSSVSQAGRKLKSASESHPTSQNACSTSWSRVTKIAHASRADVYDIEVEGSHCFFANNLLVHNCHAHLSKFRTFLKAHDAKRQKLGLRPAFVLGLSATPQHKELNKVFTKIVPGPSIRWLIDNGYLIPGRYFQCTKGQLDLLVKQGDEYTADSVSAAMDGLSGDLVKDWKRLAEGRATVGFFPRRSHAQEAMELLRSNGVDAHYVDGDTPDDERQSLYRRLNNGDIDYICNVGVIERGTDIPRIGCIQLCTALGSVVRYIQIIGRGFRVHPAVKDCLVLDHANSIRRHGFFDDDIEWTLEWGERPAKEHSPRATVECPQCGQVYRGGKCQHCGYEPTPRERKAQGLEFVGGELREVTRRDRKDTQKKTCEELLISGLYIAGKRGGTFGQAWHIAKKMAEKQGTAFRVPATVEVAGHRYRTIPYGHPDGKLRIRDTYGFTIGKHSDADNPYRIRQH